MSSERPLHEIDATTFVDAVMRACPATIDVFLRLKLHCVGCPVGAFHTVEDAAREHKIDWRILLDALLAEAAASDVIPPFPPA